MAFKLKSKSKPVTVPEVETKVEVPADKGKSCETLVDEIGDLKTRIDEANTKLMQLPMMKQLELDQKEAARLTKELLDSACGEGNIGDKIQIIGTKYAADISPAPNKRTISDVDRAVEILEEVQEGLPLQLAQFKLADLDKYMTPVQQEQCITSERKGARKVMIDSI